MRCLKKLLTWIFLLGIVAAFGYFVVCPKLVPLAYEEEVEEYATQYSVAPSLVYAVIFCESGYDAQAVSPAGAKGLMQIGDDTAVWAAEQIPDLQGKNIDIFDPATNIEIGCWYLGWLLEKFDGTLQTSLAGYNAGHNKVAQWLADEEKSKDGLTLDEIPYAETERYVKKVTSMQKIYQWRYGV